MRQFLRTLIGMVLGFAAALVVCQYAGESPLKVLQVLWQSAFGSLYNLGMTLSYAIPLLFTGIAVAIPFKAGLFNIGAEGQLLMGSIAAATVGAWYPGLQAPWSILIAVSAAFIVAAIWGGIVGFLKAKRGSHEVITSIMMNFIAAGITSWFTLYRIKDPNSQQAESLPMPESFHFQNWSFFQGAPVGNVLIFAILYALFLDWLVHSSVFGYRLKAVGSNERAAELAGIRKESAWIWAMALGAGSAGLVSLIEIFSNAHKFKVGFGADFGFVGIAVALVARGRILHVLWSAFLFGALQKGAGDLDLETDHISRDLTYWIQALIILGISADALTEKLFKRKKDTKPGAPVSKRFAFCRGRGSGGAAK